MPSPFPGMDPYIERSAIWLDFQQAFAVYLCAALQRILRPRFAALIQNHRFVTTTDRYFFPERGYILTRPEIRTTSRNACLEADPAAVFEIGEEEVRQPYIEIIELAARDRVVTVIEVLIPLNKIPGHGQALYVDKRDELWSSGANLVEIDLLRAGASTVRVPGQRLGELLPWNYLIAVTRRKPRREEIYRIKLDARLPRIGVPLLPQDPDAVVDLQAVFTRCWDEGPYPELLNYDERPPGRLSSEEIAWCENLAKGYLRGERA